MQPEEYCRQVEGYLCRKNGGHLIRIVGPSFDLVSRWATQGIPLKVALGGLDRSIERQHRKGPRRRPVRVEFCEADVLDAFDEWRRAVGLSLEPGSVAAPAQADEDQARRSGSLAVHVMRVLTRLSEARAGGRLGVVFDEVIDAVARELDLARATSHGLRGEARRGAIERLASLDVELLQRARAVLDDRSRTELVHEADDELAQFRDRMLPEAFARARDGAFERLLRQRLDLPIVAFQ